MTVFRNATLPELAEVLNWAAEEGWNPGLEDAAAFFAADPQGFFVAEDAEGHLIAAISVVNHTQEYAFLGLYIVRPEHRGQGIGLQLWKHAMRHAGDRIVGLDGVEAQQRNYETAGFRHAGGTTRYSGVLPARSCPDIRAVAPGDLPDLIAREAAASGVEKPLYLRTWFTETSSRKTLVSKDAGAINGFCTVRACRSGAKIGPLFAENRVVAHRLIAHAATMFDGPVTLDVPDTASNLADLCEQLGFETGFKTARMYSGPLKTPSPACFAVVCLELG